jgi:rifampicin phosphotransferase
MDITIFGEYILPLGSNRATLETAGGKGASLARLVRAGLPVPDGFHITTSCYRRFVAENQLQERILAALQGIDISQPATLEAASAAIRDLFAGAQTPPDIAGAIATAYTGLAGKDPLVAVRSSATAEDLPEASFAGQQETYLNLSGLEPVLEAVKMCWASLWTGRAIGYRLRQGIHPQGVALAVVVQLLVDAEAAGILFTANPLNGRRDQAMISAAWGLGEAIVGGLVTPDTLIVDKASGAIQERHIADKQQMTVRSAAGTHEQPVPVDLRRAPVLDAETTAELLRLGLQIEALFGIPVDIEWARSDGGFYILQARPVTALPEPTPEFQLDWTLPDPKGQYMRASICELMPNPLSPLFDTLGMPAIEEGINSMAIDLINMPPDTFSGFMQTVNGYAYQKVTFTRRQWWLMVTRMLPSVPRMLKEGVAYWQEVAHPRYSQVTQSWRERQMVDLTPAQIWDGVHEIMAAFSHHLGALMGSTMGPTAGSEGLFTKVYEKLVRQEGDPHAPVFLLGFDSLPIKAEKALYDLAQCCRGEDDRAAYLLATPASLLASQVTGQTPPQGIQQELWGEFQSRFRQYLEAFGYSIYELDFSKPLPMDDPEPILEALKLFVAGKGANPYERQQESVARRERAVESARARLKGFKRWAFEKSLKWAQSQAPLREDGIFEIGLGFPVLRRMLHELGNRLSELGILQQAGDIFWLEAAEIEAAVKALESGEGVGPYNEWIKERKALWTARKRLIPPAQLPPGKKYLGMNMEGVLAMGETSQYGATIKGVAASPGRVSGIARVLHGPEDFDQMKPGDVLVAATTTPAWTPLFAMASAVVTDIGGPLSHGSIVAREYGIPAVLGAGVATRRIQSGQTITVDGSAGLVELK